MSLDELLKHYEKYQYLPRALIFPNRQEEIHVLSEEARKFVFQLEDSLDKAYDRWPTSVLQKYRNNLSDSQKAEILGFYTIDVHEFTHHMDFMITPFGVNFHAESCIEYLLFQGFAKELVPHPDVIPSGWLIGSKDFDQYRNLAKEWRNLKGRALYFDAYFYRWYSTKSEKGIVKGWLEDIEPYSLLNLQFDKVLVHDFMTTVLIPDKPQWYLRPNTILEARALAHSLRWILYIFDYTPESLKEAARYMKAYYYSEDLTPDYKFLLNLFARIWQKKDIIDFVEDTWVQFLDENLQIISAICWYALQTPPMIVHDNAPLLKSPVFRLLNAIEYFVNNVIVKVILKKRKPLQTFIELFEEIDHSAEKENLSIPIQETLNWSLEYLNEIQIVNDLLNHNLKIRQHFNTILDEQKNQIKKRLSTGYESSVGLPPYGNPLLGVKQEDDLLINYSPHQDVLEWFEFRDNLMYKFGKYTSSDIKAKLENRFVKPNAHKEESKIISDYVMFIKDESVYVYIDDCVLPVFKDKQTPLEFKVNDFQIGMHCIIKLEHKFEGSDEVTRLNIIFCPFEIKRNAGLRNSIEYLIGQTFDKKTGRLSSKDVRLNILDKAQNDFVPFFHSRFNSLMYTYSNLENIGLLSPYYKFPFCPKCNDMSLKKRYGKAEIFLLHNKGADLQLAGKYDEALDCYNKLLEIAPNDINALDQKGMVLFNLGRHDEALICFDRVLKEVPNAPHTLSFKGSILAIKGQHNESLKFLKRALKNDPENVDILASISMVLMNLNRRVEASSYLRKAQEIDPYFQIKE